MRTSKLLSAILSMFFLFSSPLAGTIDQQLAEKMASAQPEEQFSVIIQMADQVDMPGLKLELKAKQAKLAERHKRVITALKDKADQSQRDILGYLNQAKNSGKVSDFKNFWISNLIWVKAPKGEIEALSKRKDVEIIFLTPKVELVKPVEVIVMDAQAPADVTGIETGIKTIRADRLWAQGYKGKNRLVCNIDTGVDKSNIIVNANWRGNFLTPDQYNQAWYDPVYGTTTPNDNKAGGSAGHGTGTMSVLCGGRNAATGDTLGVAPEAQWIAAQAIDIPADWPVEIGAMQWAADPDGDPNTLDDVPDVVNNSWGLPKYNGSCGLQLFYTPCWEYYWQALDNLAAAGPVVVFAAGNEGACPAPNLRIPADRIASDYNVFAVGSINGADTVNFPISSFSSEGPSPCDGVTKKPEVAAPGENVEAAYPGGYAFWSGTSFSAPHVAGAAALLKQINPDATSEEILRALLVTARDKGTPGDDNSYGRGVIDVWAAKDSLPPANTPHIFVSQYEFLGDGNNAPDPGENLTFYPYIINDGENAYNVRLTLSSNTPLATVTDSTSLFGNMDRFDTLFSVDFMQFTASASALAGDKLPFTLSITDDSGYAASYPLLFYVTAKPLQSKALLNKGNFLLTISNFGQYGFGSGSVNPGITPDTGVGFKYPKAGSNNLFEGAVLFGLPTGQVSDAARDYVGFLPDSDFVVAPGGELVLDTLSGNRKSDQDGFGCFTDEKAEIPIGLKIAQSSYVFSDTANDDYVIFEYTIHNTSGSTLTGLRAGFFLDFDFPWGSGSSDRAGFVRSQELGYMYQSNNTLYRGVVVTDTLGITSYRAIENTNFIYDGFTDLEKWQFMSGGFVDTTNTSNLDGSILAATGPWDIPPGDSVKTSFALVGANNLTDLQAFAQRAIDKYQTGLMCVAKAGDANASADYTLGDIISIVNYVFNKPGCSPQPICWLSGLLCRGDWNASGTVTLGDVIQAVNYYFNKPGGPWTPVPSSVCCQPVP